MNKKYILAALLVVFTGSNAVYAQEKCAKRTLKISAWEEVPESWTECVGTVKFSRKAEERAGDKYVGEFKNGKMSGQGTYTWANGDKYVGGWMIGLRWGQGTQTSANGDKYVGGWMGLKDGQGTFTWANGDKYVGEWAVGTMFGQGTMTYSSGDKYVGEWDVGTKFGQGTMTYSSGDKYVGEWEFDSKNGQGTYTSANGDKYVGEWKNGSKNGQGTYTWAGELKGQVYVGEWKEGKEHGQGTTTYKSGNKYVGEMKEGSKNGQGTFTWAGEWKGQVYVGEYKEDKRNGQGTMTYKDGNKYVGEYKEGNKWRGVESTPADSSGWETHWEYRDGFRYLPNRYASAELAAKQAAEKAEEEARQLAAKQKREKEQLAKLKEIQEKVKATKVDKNKCYTYYAHNYNLYVEGLAGLNQTARANAQSFRPQMQQNIYDQTMKTHTDNAQMLRQEAEVWKAYGGGIDSETSRYLKVEIPVVGKYMEIFQITPVSSPFGLLGALLGGEEEFIDHPLRYVGPACTALKENFKNSAENPFK
jgi:hypothetical protein